MIRQSCKEWSVQLNKMLLLWGYWVSEVGSVNQETEKAGTGKWEVWSKKREGETMGKL